MMGIVLFMTGLFLCLRWVLSIEIWCSMSKGERKKYRESCATWNRWFFISAPDYVRDKYVKSEKKRISYSQLAKQNRFICVVLHVLYAVSVLAAMLLWNEPIGGIETLFESVCLGYFLFVLGAFLFIAIRGYFMFSNYHRSRYHR